MERKRFIFDLDGTLLSADFEEERKYFYSIYGEEALTLTDNMGEFLNDYEQKHQYYDEASLAEFLSRKSGIMIPPSVIIGWIDTMANVKDKAEEGIYELLDFLKASGHSLAVLTNWFQDTQVPRLKRSGLLEYFDDIYTGEHGLKPHQISYQKAISDFNPDDCVMIGDNLEKDYVGARVCGIEAILYDKEEIQHHSVVKIKKLNEVINRFKES